MENHTRNKTPEPVKRDSSPKRGVGVKIPKKKAPYAYAPECSDCGKKGVLVLGETGETWHCKIGCAKTGNEKTQNSPLLNYQLQLKTFNCYNLGKKMGILDVLPKICNSDQIYTLHSNGMSFAWFGSYRVVTKPSLSAPQAVKMIMDSGFRVIQAFSDRSFVLFDLHHLRAEKITRGVFPADQSLAMLDPGRAWYYCSSQVSHRRPMQEILKKLTGFCDAIAILVADGHYIEIPINEEYLKKNSEELNAIVNAEYVKRGLQKHIVGFM